MAHVPRLIHNTNTSKKYIDKLKPQCEGRTTPYADPKVRSEAEIQGLKDVLSIVAGALHAGRMRKNSAIAMRREGGGGRKRREG